MQSWRWLLKPNTHFAAWLMLAAPVPVMVHGAPYPAYMMHGKMKKHKGERTGLRYTHVDMRANTYEAIA